METLTRTILERLNTIQFELNFIKEHMVDADTILTEEDKTDLAQAREEFRNKKTISLKDLKKELKL